ncbi:hypothetical protein BANRA_03666 [Acinetobacter baumannii]|nr:hypothetical protein BANRA_02508 [Acinetobacter baumannii]VCX12801.1 hypothetical protein BANRA_01315 [Acinetobacter baumannii]VCX16856.1 hypothetical protein BANRA_00936 [Acinetobacter baumannii]VCX76854.1 hypothetical protein BANRA_02890 [Acinetobacter baumannii]VCY87461.1 hypothetical protein BANRA_00935 [Acinetobacter baumannii]
MMQPTHTHSTLQYIHISVPEILLSNIQIKILGKIITKNGAID